MNVDLLGHSEQGQTLAGRLAIPVGTTALLWDMDGVLLDTLALDYRVVNALIDKRITKYKLVSPQLIRENFAYDVSEFWRRILTAVDVTLSREDYAALITEYEAMRLTVAAPVHEGVVEILTAARRAGFKLGVVSNNPEADVASMLSHSDLRKYFDAVVGNDRPGLAKKPAPDPYLAGAERLNVEASRCVVIEDSLLGAQAGHRAGCTTVGVATGANTFAELSRSHYVSYCYHSFAVPLVRD